ncbi:hypothetical protein [Maribacter ulvicola]|uniref:Uncharacterized protein n=1 Tax=Maribacter ulvicola TaxID=228959 RepID=A0A1N6V8P6_9FLAO|nr:hypothetical protein [Maribacter ulvicola]SIQ74099.1 hypothetical protein SAMN05421797_10331 [Maribacter ulvicola]
MDLTDTRNIDFSTLDIDKYLKWLKEEYYLFSRVWELPFLDRRINNLLLDKFSANSHYIATRGLKLPNRIEGLYDTKIKYLKELAQPLRELPIRVIFFKSVKHGKYPNKKYGFFTSVELEEIRIDTEHFNSLLKTLSNTWKPLFIDELEKDFAKSPFPRINYYRNKAIAIREKQDRFVYLPQILQGNFIYNLNDFNECSDFFLELSVIWEISYLEKEITRLQSPNKKTNHTLSLNPNFEDRNWQISTIFESSKPLFNSTIEQWENLFSDNIVLFDKPIELKKGISKADLRCFIDELKHFGLIRTGSFLKTLQNVNAFSINGKILTAYDYKTANNGKNYPNTRNRNKILDVFSALKV